MARVNGPPPGRSIYDATPASQGSQAIKVNTPTVPEAQDVDAVSRAAKELSSTARSDHQRIDLTDLLSQTSRESSYSEVPAGVRMHRHSYNYCWFAIRFHILWNTACVLTHSFLQWPALLSQEASIARPMPDMVLDSQRQMQAACFCGVFSEAELAWASVDNVLYVWDASR